MHDLFFPVCPFFWEFLILGLSLIPIPGFRVATEKRGSGYKK